MRILARETHNGFRFTCLSGWIGYANPNHTHTHAVLSHGHKLIVSALNFSPESRTSQFCCCWFLVWFRLSSINMGFHRHGSVLDSRMKWAQKFLPSFNSLWGSWSPLRLESPKKKNWKCQELRVLRLKNPRLPSHFLSITQIFPIVPLLFVVCLKIFQLQSPQVAHIGTQHCHTYSHHTKCNIDGYIDHRQRHKVNNANWRRVKVNVHQSVHGVLPLFFPLLNRFARRY